MNKLVIAAITTATIGGFTYAVMPQKAPLPPQNTVVVQHEAPTQKATLAPVTITEPVIVPPVIAPVDIAADTTPAPAQTAPPVQVAPVQTIAAPITPPVTVLTERLYYVLSDTKPNQSDAWCDKTYSDGTTSHKYEGSRPTDQKIVVTLECS